MDPFCSLRCVTLLSYLRPVIERYYFLKSEKNKQQFSLLEYTLKEKMPMLSQLVLAPGKLTPTFILPAPIQL